MAYVSYKDLPLYFGATSNGVSPTAPNEGEASSFMAQATQVQLNYTPTVQQSRLLGQAATKNSFALAGPPSSTLSFSCYLKPGEFTPTGTNTANNTLSLTGNNTVAIRLGDASSGFLLPCCALTSFSYSLVPFQPVVVNCEFALLNNPTEGRLIVGQADIGPSTGSDYTDYAHGAYSTCDAVDNITDLGILESVQYQFACQRLAQYNLGSTTLSSLETVSMEQSLTVQGDQIEDLVPSGGENVAAILNTIKNPDGTTIMTSQVEGRMIAENVSVTAGDFARGSMTISQPML